MAETIDAAYAVGRGFSAVALALPTAEVVLRSVMLIGAAKTSYPFGSPRGNQLRDELSQLRKTLSSQAEERTYSLFVDWDGKHTSSPRWSKPTNTEIVMVPILIRGNSKKLLDRQLIDALESNDRDALERLSGSYLKKVPAVWEFPENAPFLPRQIRPDIVVNQRLK